MAENKDKGKCWGGEGEEEGEKEKQRATGGAAGRTSQRLSGLWVQLEKKADWQEAVTLSVLQPPPHTSRPFMGSPAGTGAGGCCCR